MATQKKQTLRFQYDGAAKNIYKPIIRYAAFNVLTLFIYRFWAKTNLRRYFWSSVRLNKAAFTYHGTGKELFFGALAVLGIFIAYYIVDYIMQLLLAGNIGQSSVYGGVIFLIFLFLFHFAVFRMLRYRLTRTSWRGVRFNLDGRATRYGLWGLLLSAADLLSLRLAHPWIRSYLVNYRLNNMRFGNQKFASDLRGGQLARMYYLMLTPVLLSLILLTTLITFITIDILSNVNNFQDAGTLRDEVKRLMTESYGLLLVAIGASFLLYLFLRIFYRLFEAKTVLSQLQFAKIRFACKTEIIKTGLTYAVLRAGFYIGLGLFGSISYYLFSQHILLGLLAVYPTYLYYYYFSVAFLNWVVSKLIKASSMSGDTSVLKDVSSYRVGEPTRGEGWFELLDIGNL